MKRLPTFLLGALMASAQQPQDHHSPFSLGEQNRQTNFATPGSPPKNIRATEAEPVFPASPPDKFDFGRLSGFNEMHDSQIKDLQSRVRDVEKSINVGQGITAGLVILLSGLGLFARSFWRAVLRMLIQEAAPGSERNTAPPAPPAVPQI